jgi:glutamate/tyrosine decarboxylase-like PLP-dependent enzyme
MLSDALRSEAARVESTIAGGPIIHGGVTPQEIRAHLAQYDFSQPRTLEEVCTDVEGMLQKWQVHNTHPRYFGLFNPSVTFASVVADTLAAMYNPQLATWRTSPAAIEIEKHALAWLAGKFGLPADTSATFTTGGAEANQSAVIVALTKAFPEYGDRGLRSLKATPTIYLSGEAHHSFSKIAHMTGLGRESLRQVSTDSRLKLDLDHLAQRVAEDRKNGFAPLMVVGTGGTTGAGVIDPLPDLARFCKTENLWFHVDAAWGGAAAISPKLRHHLAGIELADSITCDAHKWFSVPMGAGMFFCRHADAVGEAFRVETSYMPPKLGAVPDPYTSSIQWSRRFIGLKLFLALAEQGESGYAGMIEHQTRMGEVLREALQQAGWRIVNSTPFPLINFTRDGLDTTAFLSILHQRQIAWMSEVRLAGGAPVLRACVTSFRTTEPEIQWVVSEMSKVFHETEARRGSNQDLQAPAVR